MIDLPQGCKVTSITPSGTSLWVQTVKIDTQLVNGDTKTYFKKVFSLYTFFAFKFELMTKQGAPGVRGYRMMEGTFASESALHSIVPEYVPKPLSWGTYKSEPDIHYYICDFVDMLDELPNAHKWGETISKLHLKSMGKSPNGKFGFSVTTHLANVPVNNNWNDSWEKFWTQQMSSLLEQEETIRGSNDEFGMLKSALYEQVIPRLLRPLETGGRRIEPCLIHSDLWPGNIKPRMDVDELCMFDACAYWGHNEGIFQIAHWNQG